MPDLSTQLFLQKFAWLLFSFTAGILVFVMHLQGGLTLINQLGKSEREKSLLLKILCRHCALGIAVVYAFITILFALFPPFFSLILNGTYWIWFIILLFLPVQFVMMQIHMNTRKHRIKQICDRAMAIGGIVILFFSGVLIGTLFTGAHYIHFEVNSFQWSSKLRGLELLAVFPNLVFGICILALSRIIAIHSFNNKISVLSIRKRFTMNLLINALIFFLFFTYWLVSVFFMNRIVIDPGNMAIFNEHHSYLESFIQIPVNSIIFMTGTVFIIYAVIRSYFTVFRQAIWFSGIGTILLILSIFLFAGLNNTVFYPSLSDPSGSLHIQNATADNYSLRLIMAGSIAIPVAGGFMVYVWFRLFGAGNQKRIKRASEMRASRLNR